MAVAGRVGRRELERRYRKCPIRCGRYADTEITNLSDFFAVFHSLLGVTGVKLNKIFWFRGHASLTFRLAPSALRYSDCEDRDRALTLIGEMKRFLEMKLPRPPATDDALGWMQVAQHYGLPTRLLDWTQNAAVALFFACVGCPEEDGLVVVLNPIELNQTRDPKRARVFTAQQDSDIIAPYFDLDGRKIARGKPTIAINPTWNTERIALQQGAFTLHGSESFELEQRHAASLLYVPILREHKQPLLAELERVGVGEMFIFPEPEHVCAHIKRAASL